MGEPVSSRALSPKVRATRFPQPTLLGDMENAPRSAPVLSPTPSAGGAGGAAAGAALLPESLLRDESRGPRPGELRPSGSREPVSSRTAAPGPPSAAPARFVRRRAGLADLRRSLPPRRRVPEMCGCRVRASCRCVRRAAGTRA